MLEQEGCETLQQLRTLTPSPKIIALSGGGQTGRLEFLQITTGGGTARTLRKPMRSHDLYAAVQEILTGP
jgi:CheY-like chemotaxis protein